MRYRSSDLPKGIHKKNLRVFRGWIGGNIP
ncbi:hypothetical protein WI0192307A02_CDS0002 [Pseudomonas phage KG853]